MSKCDCCGIEQIETGEVEVKTLGEKFTLPTYNVIIMTMLKGKSVCENCMHVYTYINTLHNDFDVSRNRIHYYADGSPPEEF